MCNLYPLPEKTPGCPSNSPDNKIFLTKIKENFNHWCSFEKNQHLCYALDSLFGIFDDAQDRFKHFTPVQDFETVS
jgi:hypothetical protein